MSTNWWLSPTKGARLGSSLWYAAAQASSSGQKGIFKWLFSAATYSNVPADGRCQLLMYRGGEKGCRKSEVGKLCDIWITLVIGRENDGQKINKRGEGIWGTERWRKKRKREGGAVHKCQERRLWENIKDSQAYLSVSVQQQTGYNVGRHDRWGLISRCKIQRGYNEQHTAEWQQCKSRDLWNWPVCLQ